MTAKKTLEPKICKDSGLLFEPTSTRQQLHPKIAEWKRSSSKGKNSWYAKYHEAIALGVERGYQTIEEFDNLLQRACAGEDLEDSTPELAPEPLTLYTKVVELLGERNNFPGSYLRLVQSVDTRESSGYGIVGENLPLNGEYRDLPEGVYFHCAASQASKKDRSKGRRPYSEYTLFVVGEKVEVLYNFCGRRLNEEPRDLEKIFQILKTLVPEKSEVKVPELTWSRHIVKVTSTLSPKLKKGQVFYHEEDKQWYFVVECTEKYEDHDGVTHVYSSRTDPRDVQFGFCEYHLGVPTQEEIDRAQSQLSKQSDRQAALAALQEVWERITVPNGAIAPKKADHPAGQSLHLDRSKKLVLDAANGRLWALLYNGRDGDDWSLSNVAFTWMGCYIPLADRAEEIQKLAAQVFSAK